MVGLTHGWGYVLGKREGEWVVVRKEGGWIS